MDLELSKLIEICKEYGVGRRKPNDPLFSEGNLNFKLTKSYGVVQIDDEDCLHPVYQTFACSVSGCLLLFDSVHNFDEHYNSCHRFICHECCKNLPSAHFLDLHIQETHDSFFAVKSARVPMYKCLLEECDHIFANAVERKEHCVSLHKFPADFRYDESRKIKDKGKKQNSKKKAQQDSTSSQIEEDAMDTDQPTTSKEKPLKKLSFEFRGRGRGRGRVFQTFTEDLKNCLPET